MAKIVDKEQKKRDIALACKELILQEGLHRLTVAQMAEVANVGKGTIYEYFRSKEELVFELARILIEAHSIELSSALKNKNSTRQKALEFSRFYYDDAYAELREIYKQFIALSLLHPQTEMLAFIDESLQKYREWFFAILQEGVAQGELQPKILLLGEGLFSFAEGLFIQQNITNTQENLQESITLFIETLFDMMERI